MPRFALGIVFALMLVLPGAAGAEVLDTETALSERVMGDPNAPVTIEEFSSLTCPHCATFHRETLPKLKEQYIDTGKAKLVVRDFPLGDRALAAAVIARCAPTDRYFGILEVMFQQQPVWSRAQDFIGALAQIVRLAGMSEADIMACLRNKELVQGLRDRRDAASQAHGIESTPTFLINGEKIVGAQPFEEFKKVIESKLGE